MEIEEEINPDTNAEADENLKEDAVEIDLEDDDLTELLGLEEEEDEEVEEVLDAKIEDTDNEEQHLFPDLSPLLFPFGIPLR